MLTLSRLFPSFSSHNHQHQVGETSLPCRRSGASPLPSRSPLVLPNRNSHLLRHGVHFGRRSHAPYSARAVHASKGKVLCCRGPSRPRVLPQEWHRLPVNFVTLAMLCKRTADLPSTATAISSSTTSSSPSTVMSRSLITVCVRRTCGLARRPRPSVERPSSWLPRYVVNVALSSGLPLKRCSSRRTDHPRAALRSCRRLVGVWSPHLRDAARSIALPRRRRG